MYYSWAWHCKCGQAGDNKSCLFYVRLIPWEGHQHATTDAAFNSVLNSPCYSITCSTCLCNSNSQCGHIKFYEGSPGQNLQLGTKMSKEENIDQNFVDREARGVSKACVHGACWECQYVTREDSATQNHALIRAATKPSRILTYTLLYISRE